MVCSRYDGTQWNLKSTMHACDTFANRKTATNVRDCIDKVLYCAVCDPDKVPVTTEKDPTLLLRIARSFNLTVRAIG